MASKREQMEMLRKIAMILVIIGALNWGLAVFGFNLVESMLGAYPTIVKIVYGAVGLSGIVLIKELF